MSRPNYVEGDLFAAVKTVLNEPDKDVTVLIPHVCNSVGAWGAGFVVPLGQQYPTSRGAYLTWKEGKATKPEIIHYAPQYRDFKFALGITQIVEFKEDDNKAPRVVVYNMVAQKGLGPGRVVKYDALAVCMDQVRSHAKSSFKSPQIHCPMFGAGLGGGDWNFIEQLIVDAWSERGLPTTVYYLPGTLPGNWTLPNKET